MTYLRTLLSEWIWVRSEEEECRSDFSIPATHGTEIVTTGLIVRQSFMNARLDLYMVLLL